MDVDQESRRLEDLMDEVKRTRQGKEVVNVEEEKVKIVLFRLGGKAFAFPGSDIKEILSGCDIHSVPALPEFLPGLINVRGDIESAVDIACFLGCDRQSGGKALIAMVEKGDFRSGVIIDAVEDVTDIPQSCIHPPLATLDGPVRDLVAGEIAWEGRTATLLDIEKLAAKVTL
ncbi:MAG: chemotaxis protein CheW [Acidobacteriota bacterium]